LLRLNPSLLKKENKTLAPCFAERFFHEVMKGGFPKVEWSKIAFIHEARAKSLLSMKL
jgi:hypothetical protein